MAFKPILRKELIRKRHIDKHLSHMTGKRETVFHGAEENIGGSEYEADELENAFVVIFFSLLDFYIWVL